MMSPMSSCGQTYGSLSIDEILLPIHDIHLEPGKIVFTATLVGPVPAATATSCTVYDPSGRVVTRGVGLSEISWPDIPAGKSVTILMPIVLQKLSGPDLVNEDHPYHRLVQEPSSYEPWDVP